MLALFSKVAFCAQELNGLPGESIRGASSQNLFKLRQRFVVTPQIHKSHTKINLASNSSGWSRSASLNCSAAPAALPCWPRTAPQKKCASAISAASARPR